jgi:hypothetical protein
MNTIALSASASSTTVYKGAVSWNGVGNQKVFDYDYTITGTVTGTLAFETSDSDPELIRQDQAGGAGYTDKATWRTHTIYNTAGTALSGISVTNSSGDVVRLTGVGTAVRPKWTNATGSATVVVRVSSRRL